MSDLDDIAAAAGISIVESSTKDGGDMGCQQNVIRVPNVPSTKALDGSGDMTFAQEQTVLESLFANRYTKMDSEYMNHAAVSDAQSHPPCIEGYKGRNQRDNKGSWQRNTYRDKGHEGHSNWRGHRGSEDHFHRRNWGQSSSYRSRDGNNYRHRDDY